MKRSIFGLLPACAGLLFLSPTAAAPSPPDVIKENLAKKFDTASDAVLWEKRSLVLEGDGRVSERVKVVQKILTDFAVDELCDPRIAFNARHQKIKIVEASTWTPDGRRVVTEANGMNLSTPESLAPFPCFADVQEMIVTHVGVEKGSITVLEYEIEDVEPWRVFFYGSESFVDSRDIVEKTLEIKVPAGKEIAWEAFNFKPEAQMKRDGEQDAYTFGVRNVPGANLHEAGSEAEMVLPCLLFSEKVGGEEIALAVMGGSYGFGKEIAPEDASRLGDIAKRLESETAEKLFSPLEKTIHIIRRVTEWTGEAVVPRDVFGWHCRKPHEAFLSGYADMYEKLGILHDIFSYMGLSPVPILTLRRSGGKLMNHPDNISGAWVRISAHGLYMYIPAWSGGTGGEPRQGKAFVVRSDGLAPADFVKPATSRVRVDLGVDMRKEPYVFSATIKLRGSYNPYWKVFMACGEIDAALLAADILGKGPLVVEKASFQRLALNETVVAVKGSVAAAAKEVDFTLASPMLASGLSRFELWRQSRETPLLVREKEIESLSIKVLYEKGGVAYAPEFSGTVLEFDLNPLPEGGGPGNLRVHRKTSKEKGMVEVSRRTILDAGIVPPGRYGKLKEILQDAFSPNGMRVIIKL